MRKYNHTSEVLLNPIIKRKKIKLAFITAHMYRRTEICAIVTRSFNFQNALKQFLRNLS